jgi:hypothetical protein
MDERVVLVHSQRFLAGAFALAALIAWIAGGWLLMRDLATSPQPMLGLYLELSPWCIGGVLFLIAFVWVSFGQRVVRVRDGRLTIEAHLLGRCFYRSESLALPETGDLRVEEYQSVYKGNRQTRYRLSAEFRRQERHLIPDMSRSQASALAKLAELARGCSERNSG